MKVAVFAMWLQKLLERQKHHVLLGPQRRFNPRQNIMTSTINVHHRNLSNYFQNFSFIWELIYIEIYVFSNVIVTIIDSS